MQIEKNTDRLRSLVQSAQSLALRSGHRQFAPLHLLKALLEDEDRLADNLIDASGGTATRSSSEARARQAKVEGGDAGRIYLAPETARVFDQAEQMAPWR